VINKFGYVVLPHYMSADYEQISKILANCNNNLTLLRYFDLKGVVEFIDFIEAGNYVPENTKVARKFASIDDVDMQKIKLHYLLLLSKISPANWSAVYHAMNIARVKRIMPNTDVDPKGNRLRKIKSVGPGVNIPTQPLTGQPLSRVMSEQITGPNPPLQEEQCAIYVTTKDAYTLTDGPTIFLATDVAKVAKFCIQQANIPVKIMEDIMGKIEFNNKINERISIMEKELEDLVEKNASKKDTGSDSSKSKNKKPLDRTSSSGAESSTISKLEQSLDQLRSMIKSAQLNELFVPNKSAHSEKWAGTIRLTNAFTSDIDDETIIQIMALADIDDSWKILLLMGIGVFADHKSIAYTEIMKKMADSQKLFLIIASSDYIYGTNYQFCHGYLSKDLNMTQEKVIQACGRLGRNNIQQDYSIRFRDDEQLKKLFYPEENKTEVRNMNRLFNSM
jgi:hypothetical protein